MEVEEGSGTEVDLLDQCRRAVDELAGQTGATKETRERAGVLLEHSFARFRQNGDTEESIRYWAACALMASSCPSKPLPIARVLRAAGGQMKMTDFFEWTKIAAADACHGNDKQDAGLRHGQTAIRRMERAFMVSADVFRKYTSAFELIAPSSAPQEKSKLYSTLWLFYVYARNIIFHSGNERSPLLDHVPAFHFLIACMIFATEKREIIEKLVQDRADGPPKRKQQRLESGAAAFVDLSHRPELGATAPRAQDPIRAFCEKSNAIYSEVAGYLYAIQDAMPTEISSCFPLHESSPSDRVSYVFDSLTVKYEAMLEHPQSDGCTDERLFTDAPELISSRESNATVDDRNHSPKKVSFPPSGERQLNREGIIMDDTGGDALDALAAVAYATPRSPAEPRAIIGPVGQPQTPVSVGVIAVMWLQNLARSRPETPVAPDTKPSMSTCFHRFVSQEMWDDMYCRALRLLNVSFWKMYSPDVAAQRTRDAIALYFYNLEGILLSEEKRLKRSNFHGLLSNETFHRALLACAAESASIAYGRRDFSPFPGVLKDYELDPFDLTKVVESFLRHTRGLPRTIARHLARCEERVLESLAWAPSSQLVRTLKRRERKFTGHEGTEKERGEEEDDNDDVPLSSQASQEFLSASQLSDEGGNVGIVPEEKRLAAPDVITETKVNVDGGDRPVIPDAALEIFFRKILFVTSGRVQELSSRAGLSPAQAECVWSAMKIVLSDRWRLLVGRHLDQIIMCCVYGVAKVNRNGVVPRFRDITHWYRTLAHTRDLDSQESVHAIYCDVLLTSNGEEESRGDIIKFYNKVFVQQMKSFLLEHQTKSSEASPVAPPASSRSSSPSPSPAPLSTASSSAPCVQGQHHSSATEAGTAEAATAAAEPRDPIKAQISSSPMRPQRSRETPTRVVGKVTVTSMSPRGRMQMSRAGLGTPLGSLSPGTRTLYAFGESPVLNMSGLNRSLVQGRRLYVGEDTQSSNGEGAGFSAIRRKYADVFSVAPAGARRPGGVGNGVVIGGGGGAAGLPAVLHVKSSSMRKPPLPPQSTATVGGAVEVTDLRQQTPKP